MNLLQVKKYYPPDQNRIIEQIKFLYSPLGKGFEKNIETIENQGESR